MKSKSQNYFMPKLKFKSFISNWGKVLLGELSTKVNQKNNDFFYDQVLTNSAIKGIVLQSDYFERAIVSEGNIDGYYIVKKDDFVYNPRISKNAPVGPISRNKLIDGVMSPLYTVFRVKNMNLDFIDYYFKSNHWHRYMKSVANYGARHDRMAISKKDFFKLPIPIPSIEEQNKIAEFLSSVDKKIQLLEKKKEQLELYKKGVMQKIFSREIRFKDENGNSYSDWEIKTMGDVIKFLSDYTANGSFGALKENVKYFSTPNYAALVRTTDLEKKFFEPKRFTDKRGYDFLKKTSLFGGEIIMANVGSIGKVYKAPNKYEGLMTLAPNTYVLKFHNNINEEFIFQLMLRIEFKYKLLSMVGSSTLKAINKSNLRSIKIELPFYNEQKKIADFLSAIDNKIDTTSIQIDKTKEFKKGLLQQMFV